MDFVLIHLAPFRGGEAARTGKLLIGIKVNNGIISVVGKANLQIMYAYFDVPVQI